MLKTLDIENIAVIEKASVNFSGGLNVLTGETGAGKSIVVDSINAIMGERTSRELVRYGADNAYVSAYFDDICDSALNKLKEFDIELEEDNSLLITRKISANGKSLCKVNGKTVTVSMLKEICSYLVNVHGQHDSQALLNPDLQYNYIDMLLEDKSVLSDYKETFKKLISVRRKLKSFAKDEDNKESLLELLNFQIEELEKADIKVGEREELTQKRMLIQKSEDIIKSLNLAISVINGDDENTVDTLKGITGKKLVSVGRGDGNEWIAKNVDVPGGFHSKYDAYHNGEFVATVHLSVPGEHNVLNSLCAFAAAYESGADVESICEGLQAFKGAGRRFELLGKYNGITFADDYAHHPKELKVTLEAAMKMGFNRVWAVHQPFTYTRTSILLDDFAKVLQIPDECVISAIMGSREVNTIGIKAKDLADKVPGSVQLDTFDEIADYVLKNAKSGDLVITLGCGDVYKVSRMMIKKLKEQGYKNEQ
jgi:energy-coupling factor transporter ATP-binding protein EcfA2